MHPLVVIVPLVLVISGVLCFFLLPVPLPVRLAVLFSELVAAAVVAFVLSRRLR
jgi:hypothetical protein